MPKTVRTPQLVRVSAMTSVTVVVWVTASSRATYTPSSRTSSGKVGTPSP